MNVAGIIKKARSLVNVSEADISDLEMLEYLNMAYHDVFNFSSSLVGKSLLWNEWITDLVEGQREYTIQYEDLENSLEATRKVLNISYKDANGKYKKVRKTDLDSLKYDDTHYNQTGDFRFRADTRSVFIYPIPTVTIPNGLKITGTYVPFDLVLDDEEEDILLEKQFHQMLLYGFCVNVSEEKSLFDKATYFSNKYLTMQQTFKIGEAEQQEVYDMGSAYNHMDGYLDGINQFC